MRLGSYFTGGITPGTARALKALVPDANKDLSGLRNLTVTGNIVSASQTISPTELGYLDGAGLTVVASKVVVADADKDIVGVRKIWLGTNGAAGFAGELDIQDGANPGVSAALTYADLVKIDAITNGTVAAGKAVVVDASLDVGVFRNVTINGYLASSAAHLLLNSGISAADLAGKTVRLNSITNIGTANSLIGFQSKPAQGAATAQNVIGCEISPRVNDTFALTGSGTLIGAHIDAYLKGTTGDIAGDVRGAQIELVTDDAGTRTITGDVVGLRMRAAFSGTISGNMTAIKIEKAEAQTNSKQWEYALELTGDNALVWRDDYTTEPADAAGAIKVRVNGADRWIQLYSTAPSV